MYNGGKEEGGKKDPFTVEVSGRRAERILRTKKQSVFHSALTLLTTYIPDLERYTERYTYLHM